MKDTLAGTRKDRSLVRLCESGRCVAYIPVELIFSETKQAAAAKDTTASLRWREFVDTYSDVSLLRFSPLTDLYEYFLNGAAEPNRYLAWFDETFRARGYEPPHTHGEWLAMKYDEFTSFQSSLTTQSSAWLEEDPIELVWNKNGYFNLNDGFFNLIGPHHRAVFLMISGFRYLPALMSQSDYLEYRNDDVAFRVHQHLVESGRSEFYAPINNPFFFEIPALRDKTMRFRLYYILRYLGVRSLRGTKVIDIGSNTGYFSQHFAREGADVTSVEPFSEHYRLAKKLDKLFYTHCEIITDDFQELHLPCAYEIGILLTVFYHYFSNPEKREKFAKALNNSVKTMIFYESGGPETAAQEIEYIASHTKFNSYQRLAYTYGTWKTRELGVFTIKGQKS